jgi:ribosomal protein S27E
MPSYLFCKECKEFSVEFDPVTKVATCKGCGQKITPQIRDL